MAKFWLENDILKSDESLDKFDEDKKREIRLGLENGLTSEQVSIYAKPEFDSWQMKQIRFGLENPEFNWEKMDDIRKTIFSGVKDAVLNDLKASDIDDVTKENIERKSDGIYLTCYN